MSNNKKNKPNKAGLPPESAIYTGQSNLEESVVTIVQYNDVFYDEKILRGLECTPSTTDKVTWYDVRGLKNIPTIEHIGETFDVHPLAIEDVLNTTQRPKWEDYQNGIFVIIRALRCDQRTDEFIAEQVSFYLGKDILLTFQEDADDLFIAVRERLKRGQGKIRLKGVDFLMYALFDCIVDDYISVLDKLEYEIQAIETEILTNFTPSVRNRIYKQKRQLTEIRRYILPLKDVISRFSREEGEFVKHDSQVYIRDLYDHVVRVYETVENQRDMVNNLTDLFNSEETHQANHVVKVLTIVSAIFIPLTFIVGVYGTNFEFLPELHYKNAYFWMWAIMILLAGAQLVYFRWKKWL